MQRKEIREAIQTIKEYGDLPSIACYAGQLNQVFMNILNNGIGMSEETKERLFDAFFTTKPIGKGTGLGLAIAP